MGSFLFTTLSFLLAIGILVTVHEYGHFWVARRLGVKVLRFSVGFGRPLWKRVSPKDGTEYVLAAIPLGGYVKMLDEREAPVADDELERAFNRQGLGVRTAIVCAGPAANFLFAILAFWVVLMAGELGTRPFIGEVAPDSAAQIAGFEFKDEVLAVGDVSTPTWESVVYALLTASVSGQDLPIQVRDTRDNELVRYLPSADLTGLAEQEDPLAALGMTPFRPSVPPVVGQVLTGEPAHKAGIQVGDLILQVDGAPINDWSFFVTQVQEKAGHNMTLLLEREGEQIELDLQVAATEKNGHRIGRIGAAVHLPEGLFDDYRVEVRQGPVEAMVSAVGKTWDISALILRTMGRLVVGQASVKTLSGPLSIAQSAGKTASYGLVSFLKFLAWVSISLGVLNLLPIPILDGGHLLFFLFEAVKGAPLSEDAQLKAQQIGLVILMLFMALAFYVDFARLLG